MDTININLIFDQDEKKKSDFASAYCFVSDGMIRDIMSELVKASDFDKQVILAYLHRGHKVVQ